MTADSAAIDTNVVARGLSKVPGTGVESKWAGTTADTCPILASGASHTIRLLCKVYAEPLDIGVTNGGQYAFAVTIVPE